MSILMLTSVLAVVPGHPAAQQIAPAVTIVSPAADAYLAVPPKVVKFTVRVKAGRDQWKPQALRFEIGDDKEFRSSRGSFGVTIHPDECDGKHEIRGEMKFASLPEGKYFVRVTVWRGEDRVNSAVQHLYVPAHQ